MATPDNSITICAIIVIVIFVEILIYLSKTMKFLRSTSFITTALIAGIVGCSAVAFSVKVAAGIAALFLAIVLVVYWVRQAILYFIKS
jgi:hypothetical protein